MRLAALCAVLLTVAAATMSATPLYSWNFEGSDPSFYSDYVQIPAPFGPTSFYDPSTYGITTDPQSGHSSWVSLRDHTKGDGTGYMMAVNGAEDNGEIVWGADIAGATTGLKYVFTFWMANVYATSPAQLGVYTSTETMTHGGAAGTKINTTDFSPAVAGWNQFQVEFTAPAASFNIRLYNKNEVFTGNDFALDDLSVAQVPEPASLGFAGIGLIAVAGLLRRRRK
jgi:hypothetical protein